MLSKIKRAAWNQQRQVSQGAAVVLVCGAGYFTAMFECAKRCAEVLGNRDLDDIGDGFIDYIPRFKIDLLDISSALQKLTTKYSVALVDVTPDKHGTRFVLVHKIPAAIPAKEETPIDDFL